MNKYLKLRPPKQTPNSEICKCSGRPPFVLQCALTYNPISCSDCNLEVDLNQLNFTDELAESISNWRNFHDCFYLLWLDSGEYEEWAKEQLSRPDSPVNKRGIALNDKIRLYNDSFYWWFIDNSSDEYISFTKCPNCTNDLIKRPNKFNVNTKICSLCNIIVVD
jgi:predicted  nucleic acid-binding Zn ribbon protein